MSTSKLNKRWGALIRGNTVHSPQEYKKYNELTKFDKRFNKLSYKGKNNK